MPSAGYSHFYSDDLSLSVGSRWCVNALGGLFSFLLAESYISCAGERLCVNALGGLFSFLQKFVSWAWFLHGMCQCPRRAILISTELQSAFQATKSKSVNALGGLFSFLQNDDTTIDEAYDMCQCPRRAILISTGSDTQGRYYVV